MKSLGKLYGGPSFETGPGKNKPNDYQKKAAIKAAGTFKTGPAPVDMAGHKAKGPGLDKSGPKRADKGEDYAGQASGKRGNVRGS
jgi:hypothetical protein